MDERIKTTEELEKILEEEFQALHRKKKGLPMDIDDAVAEQIERTAGVFGAMLGVDGMARVNYFNDIREQVQKYQLEHNVSGLLIETIELEGKVLRYPQPVEWLLLTDDDKDVMKAARDRVVNFFADYIQSNCVYLSYTLSNKEGGEWDMETTLDFVVHFAADMDWATLSTGSILNEYEVSLQVGYGDYHEAAYIDTSGAESWYFNALKACRWSPPVNAKRISLGFDEIRQMRKDGKLDSD